MIAPAKAALLAVYEVFIMRRLFYLAAVFMLINFLRTLKEAKVPVSIREQMDLLGALNKGIAFGSTEEFYHLSRICLVKDEKYFDKFDQAFAKYFKGLESVEGIIDGLIPDDFLREAFGNSLTAEQLAEIESLGGLEELIEKFKQDWEKGQDGEQGEGDGEGEGEGSGKGQGNGPGQGTGQGGEGTGQGGRGERDRAKFEKDYQKAWDLREFKEYDDDVDLGTRNVKLALKRLRKFARDGAEVELDINDTIHSTANNAGYLDIKMRPVRRNTIKVLLFFDIGGSMDPHIKICNELFSASRTEFKHMENFYFHNYIYDSVWRDDRRRSAERTNTWDILHRYTSDYKIIFVGDASMAPFEITNVGGSVEHYNEESGQTWMQRFMETYDRIVWLNPSPTDSWGYTSSVQLSNKLVDNKMYPLTIGGLEDAMKYLAS